MSNGFSNRRVYFTKEMAEKLGWITGALIPCLTFILKILVFYADLQKWQRGALIAMIVGGLCYSAPTVKKLIAGMQNSEELKFWKFTFDSANLKAWGFTILVEGILVFCPLSVSMVGDSKAAYIKAITLLVLQYGAALSTLSFLAGVNGYCMAELAVARFVKQTPEKTEKVKKSSKKSAGVLRMVS